MTANFIKSSKAFSVFIVSANNRIVPLETAIDHNDPVAEREVILLKNVFSMLL